jgi:hypothetical protein
VGLALSIIFREFVSGHMILGADYFEQLFAVMLREMDTQEKARRDLSLLSYLYWSCRDCSLISEIANPFVGHCQRLREAVVFTPMEEKSESFLVPTKTVFWVV